MTYQEREILKANLWNIVYRVEPDQGILIRDAIHELDHLQQLIDQFPDNYPENQWSSEKDKAEGRS